MDNFYLKQLLEGNKRFVKGELSPKNIIGDREKVACEQNPYAIILTCSDSRVPPEIIFDESLGRLFVVRVAGNVIDDVTAASIEFGITQFNIKFILVLGHEDCGAVKSAAKSLDISTNLNKVINLIAPAVLECNNPKHDPNVLSKIIKANVKNQIKNCSQKSIIIQDLLNKGEIEIMGAFYKIKTGEVIFFNL